MTLVEMIMPKMGESIIEANIIKWLKNEGDTIDKDESVLEVATDKVDTEVPAVYSGVLEKILAKEGETVKIGSVLALIRQVETTIDQVTKVDERQPTLTKLPEIAENVLSGALKFYSPLVLNIAKSEHISMEELENILGTGKNNRVTKIDVLSFVENRKIIKNDTNGNKIIEKNESRSENNVLTNTKAIEADSENQEPLKKTTKSYSGAYEIIEMDRMRKIIAKRMLESQQISATVTSFVEADVTNMVLWKNKIKYDFMKRENEGMTYTPIFVEAVAKALKDYPLLNSSIEEEKIIVKKYINIGIAVALNDGNLIVPVIKNADRYNITGLTKAVNDLVRRAKAGKITADDLSDGTYTISNVGSFGNLMGTPIIVQPQVGIIALGSIKKKPAVIETEYGDTLGIRSMMFLSHSYDHRIIDGALGGTFVKRVADYLENFDMNKKL